MTIAQFDAGTHRNRHIPRDVNRDVPGRSLEHGIIALAARVHQLHDNAAGAGFRARRGHTVEFDAAAAGLRPNRALRGAKMNRAAARLDLDRAVDISQIDAATTG